LDDDVVAMVRLMDRRQGAVLVRSVIMVMYLMVLSLG
jgi:hypothetical protein